MPVFKIRFLAALVMVAVFAREGACLEERSPFATPKKTIDLYDYEAASNSCRISGIILTRDQGKAILSVNDHPFAVYSVNDRIVIDHNDIRHVYFLHEIREKSIVLKGNNNEFYRVEAR